MKEKINDMLKQSMINKDKVVRDLLRYINSEIAKKEKDKKKELTDEEIISILKKEKKIIEDNIKIAIEHNLSFAYNEEMTKVSILVGLIPVQLSEEQTREKIQEIFNENNFTNMGEAMKVIIPKLGGIADKKLISKIVKEMF